MRYTADMIEVDYSGAGFARKTDTAAEGTGESSGGSDTKEDDAAYSESSEEMIDGVPVTLEGDDGRVYRAKWSSNNYDYILSVNEGVSSEDMTEYVKATR